MTALLGLVGCGAPIAATGAKAAITIPCVALPIPATPIGEAFAATIGAIVGVFVIVVTVDLVRDA